VEVRDSDEPPSLLRFELTTAVKMFYCTGQISRATTLSITTFSIMTLRMKCMYVTLTISDSITMLCHYAECRVLFIIILKVIMPSVVFYLLLC
jgi:hypothetical protein